MDGNSWVSNCNDAGVGVVATSYLNGTNGWTEISGTFTTGNVDFLSAFYFRLLSFIFKKLFTKKPNFYVLLILRGKLKMKKSYNNH